MDKILLKNISIQEYSEMLRSNNDPAKINEIERLMNTELGDVASGFDLSVFMLNKDMLIFQCKMMIAILNFENDKAMEFERKINKIKDELSKKTNQTNKKKVDRYKSFISWLLSLKKYFGSDIDKNENLVYLIEATKQMLTFYESQKRQYEENRVKK